MRFSQSQSSVRGVHPKKGQSGILYFTKTLNQILISGLSHCGQVMLAPGYGDPQIFRTCFLKVFLFVFSGNGPNAISLSYILSGYVPHYIPHQHPNPILDSKLREELGKSLLDKVSLRVFMSNSHCSLPSCE